MSVPATQLEVPSSTPQPNNLSTAVVTSGGKGVWCIYSHNWWRAIIPWSDSSAERLEQAVRMLAPEFYDDAMFRYMHSTFQIDKERHAFMHIFMRALIKVALIEHAVVLEVSDWGAAGVLVPPGGNLGDPLTIVRANAIPAMLKLGLKNIPVSFA